MIKIIVSGFGSFHNVSSNPTEILINNLEHKNIVQKRVLKVGVDTIDNYLEEMKNKYLLRSSKKQQKVYFVHFGVYTGSSAFHLETQAVNEKHWPNSYDEEKNTFVHTKIDSEKDLDHSLQTKIEIVNLAKKLGSQTAQSFDCGKYICNYTYYSSMKITHAFTFAKSLFVHVPSFETIDRETQTEFVNNLISLIATGYY
ncbi:hypothetical protein M0812_02146 [Anaeramoeba flamelloides]|uniref:Pyroglutamyl-peptidase I n=1 Tax=Anaeramoeba flamelloides TaxID=1746091 RepID=A0AAV7YYV3_9EUKA|nr:hypothetical protein M0812_02146 [Anaeramoeba flamelloides]